MDKSNELVVDSSIHFVHEPLDHDKATVRLINILPELSPAGHIQCTIRHTDVNDEYTCLSYVWGDEDDTEVITINGHLFGVRRNLWDFLCIARELQHFTALWIDAICIDQNNTSERNHQVQQMGTIFSQARGVIAWLGSDPDIGEFLAEVRENPAQVYDYFFEKFCELSYWKRAWITQEIALASQITFWSGRQQLDMKLLAAYEANQSIAGPEHSYQVFNTLRAQRWKGKDFVDLLRLFGSKECKIKRDRIFSLLALGADSDLEVDYGISDAALLARVLRCYHKRMCFCTVRLVAEVLDIDCEELSPDDGWGRVTIQNVQPAWCWPRTRRCEKCQRDYKFFTPASWDVQEFSVICMHAICQRLNPSSHLLYESTRKSVLANGPDGWITTNGGVRLVPNPYIGESALQFTMMELLWIASKLSQVQHQECAAAEGERWRFSE